MLCRNSIDKPERELVADPLVLSRMRKMTMLGSITYALQVALTRPLNFIRILSTAAYRFDALYVPSLNSVFFSEKTFFARSAYFSIASLALHRSLPRSIAITLFPSQLTALTCPILKKTDPPVLVPHTTSKKSAGIGSKSRANATLTWYIITTIKRSSEYPRTPPPSGDY